MHFSEVGYPPSFIHIWLPLLQCLVYSSRCPLVVCSGVGCLHWLYHALLSPIGRSLFSIFLHCVLPEQPSSVVSTLSDLYFLPFVPRADLVYLHSSWRVFSLLSVFMFLTHCACFLWLYSVLPPPPPPSYLGLLAEHGECYWAIPMPLPAVEEYSGRVHPCIVVEAPLGILHWEVYLFTFPLSLHVSFIAFHFLMIT